ARLGRAVVVDLAVTRQHGRRLCGADWGGRQRCARRGGGCSAWGRGLRRRGGALLLQLNQLRLDVGKLGREQVKPARELGFGRALRERGARGERETGSNSDLGQRRQAGSVHGSSSLCWFLGCVAVAQGLQERDDVVDLG